MAAGRAHDDRGAGADAGVDGEIGGGVAGMQRNHDVDGFCGVAANVARLEGEAFDAEPRGCSPAGLDKVFAQFHARDARINA